MNTPTPPNKEGKKADGRRQRIKRSRRLRGSWQQKRRPRSIRAEMALNEKEEL